MTANAVPQQIVTAYATTNVTTSAYVSIGTTQVSCRMIELTDSSTKIVKLAIGASGSQTDICTCAVSGTVKIPYYLVPGTQLWLEAVDASATTGYNVVSLIP